MKIFREVQGPTLNDLLPIFESTQSRWEKQTPGLVLTGSGKAGISLILKFFQSKGVLTSKMDEVLMPKWVGYWVYNQVNEFARPVFSVSKNTKVIMPYHQYGFPQKIDDINNYAESIGAKVVEDYAHALWMGDNAISSQKFDNYRVYSFSKFFYSHALGAVSSADKEFIDFAKNEIKTSSSLVTVFNNSVKLLCEMNSDGRLPKSRLWHNLLQMSYSLYGVGLRPSGGSVKLLRAKIDNEVLCRKDRYDYFKKNFQYLDLEEYLGCQDLSPYIIPLMLPLEKLQKVLCTLQRKGFKTGIYHFDVNRNILNSNYKKVLWIMLHSGISDEDFQNQMQIIKESL